MKQNKVSGFWIRLLGRLIDLVIVGAFVVLFGWLLTGQVPTEVQPFPLKEKWLLEKGTTVLGFVEPWEFYVWAVSTMILIAIEFILIPWLTKGRTPGMFICRIKIKFNNNKIFLSILKREIFYALTWIWSTLMLMVIINHTMINQFALTDQDLNNDYTSWELARISVLTVLTSFPMFLMFGSAISIVIRKGRIGFHDTMSDTTTVWENKFVEIEKQENEIISIPPMPVKNKLVEWI